MKKITFNDRYGLTQTVIKRQKTMTRRIAKELNYPQIDDISKWGQDDKGYAMLSVRYKNGLFNDVYPQYQPGEVVAIAQRYLDTLPPYSRYTEYSWKDLEQRYGKEISEIYGMYNKTNVFADLMPHSIRITDVKFERLQDITEEDCRKEGLIPVTWRQYHKQDIHDFSPQRYTNHRVWTLDAFRKGIENPWEYGNPNEYVAESPQIAYAVLADRIFGKGTWKNNPFVFVYEFELIK